MTPVIFGKYEIGVFTDDGRYLSHGRKLITSASVVRGLIPYMISIMDRRQTAMKMWGLK